MLERVAAAISRSRMFEAGEHVGVAVSGGADSVCLLHLLRELAPRWDLRLSVLHLNHRLRGEESRRDAEFVVDLAAQLGLPAVLREVDVGGFARQPGTGRAGSPPGVLSRDHRRRGGSKVALGHTRSDQAETVLFRFLRGAGIGRAWPASGRSRPTASSGRCWESDRAEVEAFLPRARHRLAGGFHAIASRQFARNRIRHELLPQLAREWNPAIGETLANTADWARAEEAYWEDELERLAPAGFPNARAPVIMRVDGSPVFACWPPPAA